tara:strand:- start:147 stop:365 length:219 start_codon:yes stop_codon:yes gene_type:complete
MYKLRKEILKKLMDSRETRNLLANATGRSEQAVFHSVSKKQGRSIASNLDAMEFLEKEYSLTRDEIREPLKK